MTKTKPAKRKLRQSCSGLFVAPSLKAVNTPATVKKRGRPKKTVPEISASAPAKRQRGRKAKNTSVGVYSELDDGASDSTFQFPMALVRLIVFDFFFFSLTMLLFYKKN